MENNQYNVMTPSESIGFLNTDLGKLMLDKALYETQEKSYPTKVMRCTTDTIIDVGDESFTFRHWRSTVSGVSVWKKGKSGMDRAYSYTEGYWLSL